MNSCNQVDVKANLACLNASFFNSLQVIAGPGQVSLSVILVMSIP